MITASNFSDMLQLQAIEIETESLGVCFSSVVGWLVMVDGICLNFISMQAKNAYPRFLYKVFYKYLDFSYLKNSRPIFTWFRCTLNGFYDNDNGQNVRKMIMKTD